MPVRARECFTSERAPCRAQSGQKLQRCSCARPTGGARVPHTLCAGRQCVRIHTLCQLLLSIRLGLLNGLGASGLRSGDCEPKEERGLPIAMTIADRRPREDGLVHDGPVQTFWNDQLAGLAGALRRCSVQTPRWPGRHPSKEFPRIRHVDTPTSAGASGTRPPSASSGHSPDPPCAARRPTGPSGFSGRP
jgi:hypothetical protein